MKFIQKKLIYTRFPHQILKKSNHYEQELCKLMNWNFVTNKEEQRYYDAIAYNQYKHPLFLELKKAKNTNYLNVARYEEMKHKDSLHSVKDVITLFFFYEQNRKTLLYEMDKICILNKESIFNVLFSKFEKDDFKMIKRIKLLAPQGNINNFSINKKLIEDHADLIVRY